MVHYCSVPQCKSTQGKDVVSFHRFPREKRLCKVWTHHLRIGKKVTATMQVCSKHFTQDDFLHLEGYTYKKGILKKGRIPSVNLPQSTCVSKKVNKLAAEERYKRCEVRNARRVTTKFVNVEKAKVIEELDGEHESLDRGTRDAREQLTPEEKIATKSLSVEEKTSHDNSADAEVTHVRELLTPEEKISGLEKLLKAKEKRISALVKERDCYKQLFEQEKSKNGSSIIMLPLFIKTT